MGGVLGVVLVAAVVCWLLEQSEHFSDPIGENIRSILDKQTESSDGSATPLAVILPDSEDVPAWMKPRLTSGGIEMQEAAPEHYYDETYDDNLYGK